MGYEPQINVRLYNPCLVVTCTEEVPKIDTQIQAYAQVSNCCIINACKDAFKLDVYEVLEIFMLREQLGTRCKNVAQTPQTPPRCQLCCVEKAETIEKHLADTVQNVP